MVKPMREMVVGFIIAEGSVLLVEKKRPAWQAGFLNGVGGKVEPGETPAMAMERETSEETNIHMRHNWWRLFCTLDVNNPEKSGAVRVHFYVSFCPIMLTANQVEDEPLGWYDLTDIPHLHVIDNLKWLIPLATAELPAKVTGKEERRTDG